MAERRYFHPSYGTEFKIEPRIKPLVDIMNDVPFIKTDSSCEGHFEDPDQRRHQAYVSFEIQKGSHSEFIKLVRTVYELTKQEFYQGTVEFHQRLFSLPDEVPVYSKWRLIIEPSENNPSPNIKRSETDRLISLTTQGVRNYISQRK